MKDAQIVQLAQLIDSGKPERVLEEVKKIFTHYYPARNFTPVKKNFAYTLRVFRGLHRGYRACNTEYHNLGHTMDALLASARLVDGRNMEGPALDCRLVVNLLNAALLHDTGYIQEEWDTDGTGAKYTTNHVERSILFLEKNGADLGIGGDDMAGVERLIRCTGLSVDLDTIPFGSDDERYAGCLLGSADLMGQMSDRAYLEKLIFLYNEFREAGIPGFNTEFDILRKTVDFYEITLARLKGPYMAVYDLARRHFRERFSLDSNLYMDAISRHIEYLHKIIEDDTTNFRHKLKRGAWIHQAEERRH